MNFPTTLPPAVAAWFVEMHTKATPGKGDTKITFQVEAAYYTVWISRDGGIYDAAAMSVKPLAPAPNQVAALTYPPLQNEAA